MTAFLTFIAALAPELFKLFRKHGGDATQARRDLQSRVADIQEDEAVMDKVLASMVTEDAD